MPRVGAKFESTIITVDGDEYQCLMMLSTPNGQENSRWSVYLDGEPAGTVTRIGKSWTVNDHPEKHRTRAGALEALIRSTEVG